MTDLVLMPAACYPVYPADRRARPAARAAASRSTPGGAYVFRHEPSGDPARLQMFHHARARPDRRARDASPPGATPGATARSSCCAALGLDADFDVAVGPVLRPRGPDARREPARAGAEVRDPGADRRRPSRRRSRRSTTTRTTSRSAYGIAHGRRRRSRTPPASASATSGSSLALLRDPRARPGRVAGRGAAGAVGR